MNSLKLLFKKKKISLKVLESISTERNKRTQLLVNLEKNTEAVRKKGT